jgi:Tfp pilus assembly protein FimT
MGKRASILSISNNQAGLTLMEILIVITLLIIVAGFGLVISLDSYRSNNFQNQQNLLLSLLLKARGQAMANINQKPHGVYLDQTGKTYTLFQGSSYTGRSAADTSLDATSSADSSLTLTNATSTIFTQLTGTTTAATITLDDHIHTVFNICINAEGQINVKTTCP